MKIEDILYRGVEIGTGKVVEGFPGQTTICSGESEPRIATVIYDVPSKPFDGGWHEVDDELLWRYTGLQDKNGNKVFEMDVIQTDDDDTFLIAWYPPIAAFVLLDTYYNVVPYELESLLSQSEIIDPLRFTNQ